MCHEPCHSGCSRHGVLSSHGYLACSLQLVGPASMPLWGTHTPLIRPVPPADTDACITRRLSALGYENMFSSLSLLVLSASRLFAPLRGFELLPVCTRPCTPGRTYKLSSSLRAHIYKPGSMASLLDTLALAPIQTLAPLGGVFHNTTSLQTAIHQNTLGIGYAGAG